MAHICIKIISVFNFQNNLRKCCTDVSNKYMNPLEVLKKKRDESLLGGGNTKIEEQHKKVSRKFSFFFIF